jgi:hypothetical protein
MTTGNPQKQVLSPYEQAHSLFIASSGMPEQHSTISSTLSWTIEDTSPISDTGEDDDIQYARALQFVGHVQQELINRQNLYNEFLDTMKNYDSRNGNIQELVANVYQLLRGYNHLIVGFTQFLPANLQQTLLHYVQNDAEQAIAATAVSMEDINVGRQMQVSYGQLPTRFVMQGGVGGAYLLPYGAMSPCGNMSAMTMPIIGQFTTTSSSDSVVDQMDGYLAKRLGPIEASIQEMQQLLNSTHHEIIQTKAAIALLHHTYVAGGNAVSMRESDIISNLSST